MSLAVEDVLARVRTLDPLPRIVHQVLDLSSRPEVVPGEVIAAVRAEPAITAKVLRLCNSAYYGFARQISSIGEAGNMLGVNTLVNLVITACAGRYFREGRGMTATRAEFLWKRSVTCALAANRLAKQSGRCDPSTAYTAGLLLEMGTMAIEREFPGERTAIQRELAGDPPGELLALERKHLGLDHAAVGGWLANEWRFPRGLVAAIRFHHEPARVKVDRELVHTAACAHALADAREIGGGGATAADLATTRTLLAAGLDRAALQTAARELQRDLERAAEFVS